MSKFPKPTKLYSPELVRMSNQYQRLQSSLVFDSIALDIENVYHCEHDVLDGHNPGLVPPNTPRNALPNPYFPEEEEVEVEVEVEEKEVEVEEEKEEETKEVEVPEPVVTEFVEPVANEVPEEVSVSKPKMSFFDIIRATKRQALVASVEAARLAPRREPQGAPAVAAP